MIILDLALDILFIVTDALYFRRIFIFSVTILVISFIFNSGLSFYIFIKETRSNEEFKVWIDKYTQSAAILTLISGSDVSLLTILYSQFAGLKIFSASFSDDAKKYIAVGSTVNFFIEDIPQFIIQIVFYFNTISYNIIPLLNLITSSIVLVVDLLSRVYEFFSKTHTKLCKELFESN